MTLPNHVKLHVYMTCTQTFHLTITGWDIQTNLTECIAKWCHGNLTGGWMRMAYLDMRNSSHQCPSRLILMTRNSNPRRFVVHHILEVLVLVWKPSILMAWAIATSMERSLHIRMVIPLLFAMAMTGILMDCTSMEWVWLMVYMYENTFGLSLQQLMKL